MDFMGPWRRFSQRQYDSWGSKLQGKYDACEAWHFSDETNAVLAKLFDGLPRKVKKYLAKFMTFIYRYALKKYGIDFIESLIERLVAFFEAFLGGIKESK